MNIFKNEYSNEVYCMLPVKINTSKHIPLCYIMKDLFFIESQLNDCYNYFVSTLKNKTNIDKKLIEEKIKQEDYFSNPIFIDHVKSHKLYNVRRKSEFKSLLFYKTINYSYRNSVHHIGLGTLFNLEYSSFKNNEYILKFGLFVKPEFINYVRCCLILDRDFEFDCLYFLADKRLETLNPYNLNYSLYKTMLKYCKDYGIEVTHIENLHEEISYKISDEFKNLNSFKEVKVRLAEIHNSTIKINE